MQIDISSAVEIVGGVVTTAGSIYTGIKHIISASKKKEERHKQVILTQANESIEKVKLELEDKIKALQAELDNQKENIAKDLGFLKETYSNEFKNLAEKISEMRDQLADQHKHLLALLTKLVDP